MNVKDSNKKLKNKNNILSWETYRTKIKKKLVVYHWILMQLNCKCKLIRNVNKL